MYNVENVPVSKGKLTQEMEGAMSAYFQLMQRRRIHSANYITMINPTPHPDRILDEHDILYMLDGTWEIAEEEASKEGSREKNIYSMRTDDLLLLPAGRHHYGAGLCSANNRHMYIHVIPLECEQSRNASLPPQETDTGMVRFASLIHCQDNPRIKSLFQEIIAESWSSSSLREDKLSLLLNLLLCELAQQQEKPDSSLTHSRSILDEASRLIQTTPQSFFTGKELADRFFVCERTLSNQFKKAYGKTLYAYQMDVKLEMVRQFLLAQPDVKLHETALNFGFCDEFHLSRTFRKRYGISPSRYRELNSKYRELNGTHQEQNGKYREPNGTHQEQNGIHRL